MNLFTGSMPILDLVAAVLVVGLGADEWTTRETCSKAAARCEFAQPWLYAARFNADIEVARRAERLTDGAEAQLDRRLIRLLCPEGFNRWPYLDWSLGAGGGSAVQKFMNEIEIGPWGKHPFPERHCDWLRYREATRRYVRDELSKGADLANLRTALTRGAEREIFWLATGQQP